MHSTLAIRALRSIHPPTAVFRSAASAPALGARATPLMFAGAAARPVMAKGMGMSPTMMLARRWNTQENKGGRAKLIFRFGLRDIPVELYPMAFVVAVACVGAAFAVGRHFYLDGLRTGPAGKTATTE